MTGPPRRHSALARQLRYEPDEMMSIRIAPRVREPIAAESQAGIAQMLARWFRPVVVSLATPALVATSAYSGRNKRTTYPPPRSIR
jgi:hypothetical protein